MRDAPTWSAGAVYAHTWVSHLCMHKRVEAHVHARCPSAVMVDNHTHLIGQDMMEMGIKWNTMMRTKNHTHSICMILHTHEVRGGDMFV